jgi:nitrite reductase (cytochrome c-552)
MREGALKISDHHVQSPLLNINRACQTCHRWPEAELQARVETIQDRQFKLRNVAMDALVALIDELRDAKAKGKSDAELAEGQEAQRHAQFYLDFVEAENSMGFHAPDESARILGEAIDLARRGQLSVRTVLGGCPSCEAPAAVRTEADAGAPDGGAVDGGQDASAPPADAAASAAPAPKARPKSARPAVTIPVPTSAGF